MTSRSLRKNGKSARAAAEAKLLDIKTSENTIRTFEGNAREQLDSQKKRMRDPILQEIRTAINAKAKTAGYTMVIDTAAEGASTTRRSCSYQTVDNDMTDAILAQLNAGAPPAAPATKEDPRPTDKKDVKAK